MSQPDQNTVPEGYEPRATQPSPGQPQGDPAGPPQQYAGQQHQQGQYPPAPRQGYNQPQPRPQHGQYPTQPPMPHHAYGYAQPKSKVVAGLLGIFLGGLGIHRFYLGFTKIAVIQLILTLVLGVFTFGLVGLWGVVEGIMIIAGSAHFRSDAQGIPLRD